MKRVRAIAAFLPVCLLALTFASSASAQHNYTTYIHANGAYVPVTMGQLDAWVQGRYGYWSGQVTVYVNTNQYSNDCYGPSWRTYARVNYHDGRRHGEFIRYRLRDGHPVLQRTPYRYGSVCGTVTRYDPYGRVVSTCDYNSGQRHGWEIEYGYRNNGSGVYVRYESDRTQWNRGVCGQQAVECRPVTYTERTYIPRTVPTTCTNYEVRRTVDRGGVYRDSNYYNNGYRNTYRNNSYYNNRRYNDLSRYNRSGGTFSIRVGGSYCD